MSGATQGMVDAGYHTQVNNPILTREWASTTSAWTGKGGFTSGAVEMIQGEGVSVRTRPYPTPVGSRVLGGAYTSAQSSTFNGDLARDAIALLT
jgi:hypothetical protein